MRLHSLLSFLLLLGVVGPAGAAAPLALVGAILVDGRGGEPVADSVVVVLEGSIQCAGARSACDVPDGAEVVDLAGRWITPGIVDAHVHFGQTGWADGRPDAIDVRETWPYPPTMADLREEPERFFRSFLCSGVTAVFDVGGYPWTMELDERAARSEVAPHIAAAGPLVSTLDHWLNLPAERQFLYAADPEAVRDHVRYLASRDADAVKVWYLDVEERETGAMQAAVEAAGDEAARAGLPLIVHSTELETAKRALRAGAKLLVHSVWDRPVDDELIALMRENGTIYCPTLTVSRGYLRLGEAAVAGRAPEIDDPNRCVSSWVRDRLEATAEIGASPAARGLAGIGERVAEQERIGAANLKRLAEAGIPIAMGTDAGNPLTLHGPSVYAEMEAMQAAGMPPMAVVVASTLGGAKAMGMDDRIGTIEAGKAADLLVLEADPTADVASFRRVSHVMRGGAMRSVEELRPR